MTGQVNGLAPDVRARLRPVGPCLIPGRVYRIWQDGIDYPALVPADDGSVVHGELFCIGGTEDEAATVLAALDIWEDCRPDDEAGSAYVRRQVSIGETIARVYYYNGSVDQLELIADGRWEVRRADRKVAPVFRR